MTRFRSLTLLPAAAVALSLTACSDDDSDSTDDRNTETTVASTSDETGTGAPTGDTVNIEVTVGTDSGEERVEQVPLGAQVILTITDPAAAQSYHLHGYDLEQDVAAGEAATFRFTASEAGTFEVESHETDAVIVVLEVA